jgi:hypothetical protein
MIIERDSEKAAAYSTLHCTVTAEKNTLCVGSEETRVHFVLGPTWKSPEGGALQPIPKLRMELREGKLPATHPLLRQLVTSENRRVFLSFLQQPHLGLHAEEKDGITHLSHRAGQGLPGLEESRKKNQGVFKTANIRTTISLITAGHLPKAIDGNNGQRSQFYLAFDGPTTNAANLVHSWRDAPETLPHDSTFLLSMAFLHNREILLTHVNQLLGRLILRKPNTTRSIIIPSTASGKTWDEARKFLLG